MKLGDLARRVVGLIVPRRIVTLHHLACSGGTIITKCLTTMPEAMVLSEIHPDRPTLPEFHPLSQLWRGYGELLDPIDRSAIRGHFIREIVLAYVVARSLRRQLIIRDHAHVDFAWRGAQSSALVDTLSKDFKVTSIVTIRDPREVWLSLRREGWFEGNPEDLCRAQLNLLDAFPDAPVFLYEDFVAAPEQIVRKMCEVAGIKFVEGFDKRLKNINHLTGDSGRTSDVIAPRPTKILSEMDHDAFDSSASFRILMNRIRKYSEFGYAGTAQDGI